MELIAAPVQNDAEIESFITSLGREPGGGLVVMGDTFTFIRRAAIITLAARNNVPAIYSTSVVVRDGGLLSYGLVRRNQTTTVSPARFERWATFGFFIGLFDGAVQIRYSWEGDGIRLNLIELFSMGIGFAMIGVILASLWNWAGRTR